MKGMNNMRKLNVYDVVSVTSPRSRLLEVEQAENILNEDYKVAENTLKTDCYLYDGVQNILSKRNQALIEVKEELQTEVKKSQAGIFIFGKIVHFKDINVEKAVREELEVYNRPIIKQDMREIKQLCIEGVYSLEGLQYAKNIEYLSLSWTDIFSEAESDRESAIIFSLIRPSLKNLVITHSVINQFTALSVLYNLENLNLSQNYGNYFDFSTFGLLTKVNQLVISENSISPKIKSYLNKHPELLEHIDIL